MDERELTPKELEKIQRNLKAFLFHFKPITIKKNTYNKCYFIYQEKEPDHNIQMCESIQYLNGWLYGAVQAKCKIIDIK